MKDSTEVWPVLVVNGRLLVAPDFLVDRTATDPSITGILKQATNPGIPPVKDTIQMRTFHILKVGPLTAYFRSSAITGDLVNRPSTDVLYDQASRPRHMIEGFITRDAVDGHIDPALIDNLRPRTRSALERYINDTSSWPATEQSRGIRIADIVAPEAKVAIPTPTEPKVTVPTPTEPDVNVIGNSRPDVEPPVMQPPVIPETEVHSTAWPPAYIVTILLTIGAITGVILYIVITTLL